MIAFDSPMPFEEALAELKKKGALPTGMSSEQLRKAWPADLRRRSLFSARTTKAELLEAYRAQLKELLDGKTNIATARAKIQDSLDALGYHPETGFGDDEGIPSAEPGSLRDLSSNKRVDLVLRTNLQQVANFAMREAGQTPGSLWSWPCYELVRVQWRAIPRGKRRLKGGLADIEGVDWPSRWAAVGGEFYGGGRMIARKDDEIWGELGSSENFDDALDTEVPPFAFNSGMGWREVSREDAITLGVIDPDDEQDAEVVRMNDGLSANADNFSADFLKALRAGLDTAIQKGRLELK